MANIQQQEEYNPRWFIWTIVFLVATGISLVGYITLSDSGTYEYQDIPKSRQSASQR